MQNINIEILYALLFLIYINKELFCFYYKVEYKIIQIFSNNDPANYETRSILTSRII
jgi:hypothetical protein